MRSRRPRAGAAWALALGLAAPGGAGAETPPLHVRFADGAGHRCTPRGCTGPSASVLATARAEGLRIEGCYGLPAEHLRTLAERGAKVFGRRMPDLTQCFTLTAPDEAAARRWSGYLGASPGVLWVERATPVVPAQRRVPDLSADQFFLDDAPIGLGIRRFWEDTGLRGQGATFVDIEIGLAPGHVELARFGDLYDARGAGTPFFAAEETDDHGLACTGIVVAAADGRGTDGIAPDARPYFFTAYPAEYTWGVGPALLRALGTLSPGDVVLLELQRPGPAYDADLDPSGQWGMVPIEWSRVDRDAILTATALGIAVIEPAGNGFQDLDEPIYEGRFTEVDSGALMIGAGNPPTGDFGEPREVMDYSNRGGRLDLQGYGAQIVSPGYGDLWGTPDSSDRYTAEFGGTSAASPQVAGVALLLASLLRAEGLFLTPGDLRAVLVQTGTPGAAEIGPLPNAAAAAVRAPAFAQRRPPPEAPHAWSACDQDRDCRPAPDLSCVEIRRNEGYCLPVCEPFASEDESACAAGFGCGLQVWGGGICLRREGAGHTGDLCLSEMDCDLNYYCDQSLGCQPLCSVERNAGCGPGQSCLFAGDLYGDWGVCAEVSPNPDGRPDGAACDRDADCQGGTCADPGTGEAPVCTTLGCRDDADCHGAGVRCIVDDAVGIPYCGLLCRRDADCADGWRCLGGACGVPPPPECLDDTDCRARQRCVEGACVDRPRPDCVVDADCPAGRVCSLGGTCEAAPGCRADAECPENQRCVEGACLRVPTPPCPAHRVFRGGVCISDGTCEDTADCDARYRCEAGRCVRPAACGADADCIEGWLCRADRCVPPRCREDAQCGGGFACVEGLCEVLPCVLTGTCGAPSEPDATRPQRPDAANLDGGPPDAIGINPLAPDGGETSNAGGRGCGCTLGGGTHPGAGLAALALLAVLRPRRRSRPREAARRSGVPRATPPSADAE